MAQMTMTPAQFEAEIESGPYAWPGGYPRYFVTADGCALSFKAAEAHKADILDALRDGVRGDSWMVAGCDVNWEDPDLYCDHTGKRIESAYAEDDAAEAAPDPEA